MAAVRPQRDRAKGPAPRRLPGFRFYQDSHGDWRWRLVSANGRTVADSAEGYKRRAGAERGAIAAAALARVILEATP